MLGSVLGSVSQYVDGVVWHRVYVFVHGAVKYSERCSTYNVADDGALK